MPVAPFITKQNAVELGRKSGEARRNKPVRFMATVPRSQLIVEPDIARTVSELLKVISEQIVRTRALLNAEPTVYCEHCEQGGEMPVHHRAQLLKALDSLIEREQDLLGIPGRGQRRPREEKRPSWQPTIAPMPASAPVAPVLHDKPSAVQVPGNKPT